MIWYCQKCKKLFREDPGRRCTICGGKIFHADSETAFLAEGYGYDDSKARERGEVEAARESFKKGLADFINNFKATKLEGGGTNEQKEPSGKKEREEAALLREEEERIAQIKRQKEIEREKRQKKLEEQRKKARTGSTPEPSRPTSVRREEVSSYSASMTDGDASAKDAESMLAGLGLQRKKS